MSDSFAFAKAMEMIGILRASEIRLIFLETRIVPLSAESHFLEAGKISNEIGFIETGIFYQNYFLDSSRRVTRTTFHRGEFITEPNSFENLIESSEYITALEHAEVRILTAKGIRDLNKKIPVMPLVIGKIITNIENKVIYAANGRIVKISNK